MKRINILGSTGSVGKNAIGVIRKNRDKFRITALTANSNYRELAAQAKEFAVKKVAIGDKKYYSKLKSLLPGVKVMAGMDGVREIAGNKDGDVALVAISGTQSIMPTIEAIKTGSRVALASKESLVSAGRIVTELARTSGAEIIPVDSEHSAVFQCLQSGRRRDLKTIYLTSSGGPLRNIDKNEFDKMPLERIIDHPRWNMGKKITVDSATMMNKGLEIIEAQWLFSLPSENIKVVVHPEAIVHSMVEFSDSSIVAQLSHPDMKFPIVYAFNYPARADCGLKRLDLSEIKSLTFAKPDYNKFPALKLAYSASRSESASCVLNAANEACVDMFLDGKIKFTDIVRRTEKIVGRHKEIKRPDIGQILAMDKWAKEEAARLCLGKIHVIARSERSPTKWGE